MKLPRWLHAVTAAVMAIALPACDAISLKELKPGQSTVAEVRQRMGPPTAEYPAPDGSLVLEYSRQPEGIHCYMVKVGADQILVSIDQVLTEANYAKVAAGMNREQVRRLLGKPGSITTYPNKPEEVWDWKIAGDIPTQDKHFHVHFDPATGLVLTTSSRVDVKG